MHSLEGATRVVEHFIENLERDHGRIDEARVLSYLPSAHLYERAAIECFTLVSGNTRGFFGEPLETFMQACGVPSPPASLRCRDRGSSSSSRCWHRCGRLGSGCARGVTPQ
jgi:hypothetical protein